MLEFKEPCIEDKKWVDPLLEEANRKETLFNCDLPFGCALVWRGMYQIRIGRYKTFYLKTYGDLPGEIRYAFPVGSGAVKEVLEQLLLHAAQLGATPVFGGITRPQVELLQTLYPNQFTFEEKRDYAEYIYYTEDLAELKGRKYHGKRNHISKFKNTYSYTFEKITDANKKDALQVAKQWCSENMLGKDNGLSHEICAIREAFKHYDALGFQGALIKIDGTPVAMTAGERLNDEVFVVHFEKALSGYDGLYAAVNNLFAKTLPAYKYLNREEDMGIEGLRKAKLSYRPCILLEEYEARLVKA